MVFGACFFVYSSNTNEEEVSKYMHDIYYGAKIPFDFVNGVH